MNIKHYGNSFIKGNSPTFFELSDPFSRQREYELERRLRSEYDPDTPPRWQPGDKYTVTGMIIGLIVGGLLGAIGGGYHLVFIIAGGSIAGGIIGAIAGGLIGKRLRSK